MLLIPIANNAASIRFLRVQIDLLGPKDGTNPNYQTPEIFLKTANCTIEVFWNGRALAEGVDFLASEPGGPGTGYRGINLLWTKILPVAEDALKATYILGY